MALTDVKARKAEPAAKPYKLADSGGLYLHVMPGGAKHWRMKYRLRGKEQLLTFGPYPELALGQARGKRDDARRMLRDGLDPAAERRKVKAAGVVSDDEMFETIARAWHAAEAPRWTARHASDVMRSLERDIFPQIGRMAIRDIDAPTVLKALRKVEGRGAIETAKRNRQRISAIFDRAISEGVTKTNPAAVVGDALLPLPKKGRQPAVTDLGELRKLLAAAEVSEASPTTKIASRLLALTAVRPGVIRGIPWTEFEGIDWDSGEVSAEPIWRIPAARMKLALDKKDESGFEHVVPLAVQAVALLRELHRLTGRLPLALPNARRGDKPMSENAIGYLYNRVGWHGRHVPHGWRAAFSTIMNERAERADRRSDRAVIDLMLAHTPKDKVEAAYNRAAYTERRREIAQEWADLLLEGLVPARDLLAGQRRPSPRKVAD